MKIDLSDRTKRYLLLTLAFFLLAVAGIRFVTDLVDFPVYYQAGQSLLAGRTDLYAPDFAVNEIMDYRYPPLFLIVLIPLWLLTYPVAAYIWFLASVFMAFSCVTFVGLCAGRPLKWPVWLLIILAVGPYYVMSLHYGNAHLLVVCLTFGSFYFALKEQDTKAALFMALAITTKVIPILTLPYFLLKRKWKFLLLTALLILLLNLLPSLFFGFEKNLQILADWYQHVTGENASFHEIHGAIDQSLRGELKRLFTEIDYTKRYDGDAGYPLINLTSLPASLIDIIAWLVVSILYVLVYWSIWIGSGNVGNKTVLSEIETQPISQDQDCLRSGLEVGLIFCLLLMVGPITSKIYMISLLWPLFFLVQSRKFLDRYLNRLILWTLGIAALVNTGAPIVPSISSFSPGGWSRLLLVLGTDFMLNLLIMICVWMALKSMSCQKRVSESRHQESSLRGE